MQKGNINFKEIRKKVIHNPCTDNIQNVPINPTHKISFRGIKRNQDIPLIQIEDNKKSYAYRSPIKLNSVKHKNLDSSREDCKKFSILLQSKGYSNCNSARKKNQEQLSFKTLGNINTSKTRINTQRNESQTAKAIDTIQQKCRLIKQKQYFSSRQNFGELNSLSKLKNKLISPLKKKTESQPEASRQQQKIINIFEHSSILSEHDLVNMSKTNQSIDFDMSPCL